LGLVVVLGLGLRLVHAGHSLRIDELETWAYAQRPLAQTFQGSGHGAFFRREFQNNLL
jgi:hypothetical protein